jgi:hypothetical protein
MREDRLQDILPHAARRRKDKDYLFINRRMDGFLPIKPCSIS